MKTWFAAVLALWLPMQVPCSPALASLAHAGDAKHGVSLAWDHGHLHAVLKHVDHGTISRDADISGHDGAAFGHHSHDAPHVYHLGMAERAVRIDSQDRLLDGPRPFVVPFVISPIPMARMPMRIGTRQQARSSSTLASLRTTVILV